MRILFAGTPEVALKPLNRLIAAGHEVAAVLTRAPARAGRSHKLHKSPVHEASELAGLEVLTPKTLRDPEIQERIAALKPDAIAVVAYGLLVPPELLEVPTHGWINLHFSLLPQWRGAAPVQYAIAAGDEITGASTFRIESGLDTGPLFGTVTRLIGKDETADVLLEDLSESGAELLAQTFSLLETGQAVATPQEGVPSFAPTISTSQARINWTHPALSIERKIRALTPAPGAWSIVGGTRVKVAPVKLEPAITDLEPGQIRGDCVGTGNGAIRLGYVSPAGKKQMAAKDWLRGARLGETPFFENEEIS